MGDGGQSALETLKEGLHSSRVTDLWRCASRGNMERWHCGQPGTSSVLCFGAVFWLVCKGRCCVLPNLLNATLVFK